MTLEEAIDKLTLELQRHRPHEQYGCTCIAMFRAIYPTGTVTFPDNWTWERHVAQVSFEHTKGF